MHRDRIRFVSLVILCCLLALPLLAADVSADRAIADRAALIAQYESFRPLTATQRKDLYAEQTPDVQSQLWIIHLERFLAEHTDLTVEQRAVVYEGLGMLRSGQFERLYSHDPAEVFKANDDVNHLSVRVQQTFPQGLAATAFSIMGPGKPPLEPFDRTQDRWRVTANAPYCSCSTQEPLDCNPGTCRTGIHLCRPAIGCGLLGTKGCDGLCF